MVADLKKHAKVEDIVDFMNMDDEIREKIVKVSSREMEKIAEACNRYPNVEMQFELDKDSYQDGEFADLQVNIKRPDVEDEEELQIFNSPVNS